MKTGRLLTLSQLAREWGWKPDRIYRLVAQRAIPFTRIGPGRGVLYFEEHVVEEWLEQKRQEVAPTSRDRVVERAARKSLERELEEWGVDPAEARFS